MRRRSWMVLLVAAVALVTARASEASRASACDRLGGADLAPARAIKLVMRPNEARGTDLLGCALPRGRVRSFASSAVHDTTRLGYDIQQLAGAFVLLHKEYASQYASAEIVSVRDIRSGDSYEVVYRCAQLGGGDCGRAGRSSSALKVLINERGQGAAALRLAGSGATTISGFSSLGERRDFDSGLPSEIPAASLKIAGSKASWINAGRTYSAPLPE